MQMKPQGRFPKIVKGESESQLSGSEINALFIVAGQKDIYP